MAMVSVAGLPLSLFVTTALAEVAEPDRLLARLRILASKPCKSNVVLNEVVAAEIEMSVYGLPSLCMPGRALAVLSSSVLPFVICVGPL